MATKDFHEKPYDSGTLAKLKIFELYTQEWIPVFLSQPEPKFQEVHIFDFFCGPGKDCVGIPGSPLRILDQLRGYHQKGLAGWGKIPIIVHLFDEDAEKIERLGAVINAQDWAIPGVTVDRKPFTFRDALTDHEHLLSNQRFAKLSVVR